MKTFRAGIGIATIILLLSRSADAFDKVGTTAAQFLQIGVGARLTGMGGAGVALVDGPEALYWNPGRIPLQRTLALNVHYSNWIADLKHQFIGITVPVGYSGSLGASVISLGGDEFEQTTLTFQEGNGVMVEYRDLALGASYGQSLSDHFSVGGSVKYIYQKLFHETASTFAFDIGTSLKTDLPGLTIGMAMTNLGGEMKLSGRDLLTSGPDETATEYQMSSWPLPLTFQVGLGWKIWGADEAFRKNKDHDFIVAFDGRHINESMTTWRIGWEYDFRQILFLRMGRIFDHPTEKWSFGAGLGIPLASWRLQADFAYADLGDLQAVQRISLQISGI